MGCIIVDKKMGPKFKKWFYFNLLFLCLFLIGFKIGKMYEVNFKSDDLSWDIAYLISIFCSAIGSFIEWRNIINLKK
jgi:hypothetical protein